jgi:uncharacterized protein YndB with AHSA1/START domain
MVSSPHKRWARIGAAYFSVATNAAQVPDDPRKSRRTRPQALYVPQAGFDEMAAKQFNLMTEWRLDAPVERVWPLLTSIEEWPLWWRAVSQVELLKAGDANGLGSIHRITWKTALPYHLTFDTRMTRIEPMSIIEGQASGELDGRGLWTLRPEGERTHVRYDWNVEVTKPWMKILAPILRPVFAWNHNIVMGWGEEDIRSRLAATA